MKLHGIIMPPTSLAVSTPTIVPAGAPGPIVKLLIVIGMNLSTSPPTNIEDQLGAEIEGSISLP